MLWFCRTELVDWLELEASFVEMWELSRFCFAMRLATGNFAAYRSSVGGQECDKKRTVKRIASTYPQNVMDDWGLWCLSVPCPELLSPLVQFSLLLLWAFKFNQESTSPNAPCQSSPSILSSEIPTAHQPAAIVIWKLCSNLGAVYLLLKV